MTTDKYIQKFEDKLEELMGNHMLLESRIVEDSIQLSSIQKDIMSVKQELNLLKKHKKRQEDELFAAELGKYDEDGYRVDNMSVNEVREEMGLPPMEVSV